MLVVHASGEGERVGLNGGEEEIKIDDGWFEKRLRLCRSLQPTSAPYLDFWVIQDANLRLDSCNSQGNPPDYGPSWMVLNYDFAELSSSLETCIDT